MWIGDRSLEESAERLRGFSTALSHSRWFLLAWILLWAGIGLFYAMVVKPEFVAKVDIAIEPRHMANDGPEDERHYHQFALDSEQVETELRVVRSRSLLRPVFDELRLAEAPELAHGHNGFWPLLTHWLGRLSPTAAPYNGETRAFYDFKDRARSLRLGLSYVIELSYRSWDPNQAAGVANAIAAAYVGDRLARADADLRRVGDPYSLSRADALAAEIASTRAAVGSRAGLNKDMHYADVQLLGPAVPPLAKSYPKIGPTVLIAVGFGSISGLMLVLWRRRNLVPKVSASERSSSARSRGSRLKQTATIAPARETFRGSARETFRGSRRPST
jgi:uncharacterized protein involved in exopolysaccharide biosynthesis